MTTHTTPSNVYAFFELFKTQETITKAQVVESVLANTGPFITSNEAERWLAFLEREGRLINQGDDTYTDGRKKKDEVTA